MLHAVFLVLDIALELMQYAIIGTAIISWLVAFDVINLHNEFARSVWRFLNAVTEPVLRPIRQFMPNLGGVDVSPVIALLAILFLRDLIRQYGLL